MEKYIPEDKLALLSGLPEASDESGRQALLGLLAEEKARGLRPPARLKS